MKTMTTAGVIVIGLATLALVVGAVNPSAAQNNNSQTDRTSTITGCLTKSTHDTYRLVDQNGKTNMVYSTSVKLDSYVGQSVTLVGKQSATPSTDTGTSRPMPHFIVMEVHPAASGGCK